MVRAPLAFISSLSGPIDVPSPITSSVTPCRISLCDRPSAISDSTDQLSMLMKPGATANPLGVDHSLAVERPRRTQGGDPVALQGDVAPVAGRSAAVVNRAILQNEIEHEIGSVWLRFARRLYREAGHHI